MADDELRLRLLNDTELSEEDVDKVLNLFIGVVREELSKE